MFFFPILQALGAVSSTYYANFLLIKKILNSPTNFFFPDRRPRDEQAWHHGRPLPHLCPDRPGRAVCVSVSRHIFPLLSLRYL